MIYNKQHVHYLKKIHDVAIKEWFDIMLGSVWVFRTEVGKEYSMLTPDVTDRDFYTKTITETDKEWKEYQKVIERMLSDTNLFLATYHPYLEFLANKWITLPKI